MTCTLHITNKIIKLKIIFGKETAEKGTKNCKSWNKQVLQGTCILV